MGGKEFCQSGLPGFPSSSNNSDEFNSYHYVTTSIVPPSLYVTNFAKVQKNLILTLEIPSFNLINNIYTFIFNNVNALIGATDLKIGLINPAIYAIQSYSLIGSTLTLFANIQTPPPPYNFPFTIIFSISYTPAV